jgi:hypothetical protein
MDAVRFNSKGMVKTVQLHNDIDLASLLFASLPPFSSVTNSEMRNTQRSAFLSAVSRRRVLWDSCEGRLK